MNTVPLTREHSNLAKKKCPLVDLAFSVVGIITDLSMQLEEVSKHAYTSTMSTQYSVKYTHMHSSRNHLALSRSTFWLINPVELTR